MKATSGPLPVGPEWVHEVKWDGMRLIVSIDRDDRDRPVRLTSANGKDATPTYPELVGLHDALGVRSAVLDGEVVAFDVDGRPDFGRLQQRMHVMDRRQAAERATVVPTVLLLFDILDLDGNDVTGLPLTERRRLLEALVDPPGPHWQVPATHEDGEALLSAATERRLEGVISKRRDSVYRPGSRTRDWVKVKIRRRQEFVVGGWAPGEGNRSGGIGGLLVGYRDAGGGPLRYAGRVGSGLTQQEIAELEQHFARTVVERCPFDPRPPAAHARGAVWVAPELVVEVEYAEWTSEGRLRHPSYRGRRPDKDPDEVTAEP